MDINITLELQMISTIHITDKPIEEEEENSNMILRLWEEKVDACVKSMSILDKNLALAYSLVWGGMLRDRE